MRYYDEFSARGVSQFFPQKKPAILRGDTNLKLITQYFNENLKPYINSGEFPLAAVVYCMF
jgi:hypothetical protein